jgi:exopolysaccharide production protein ExoZ
LLGDASYSLYLIHPFALRPFRAIWSKFVGDALPVWTFSVACVIIAFAVGLGCYFVAERPFSRFFARKRVPPKPPMGDFSGDLSRPVPSK